MDSFEITPSTARALGNIMDDKGTTTEIDSLYCSAAHPTSANSEVEYDGINWPVFQMSVDTSLYNISINLKGSKTSLAISESTKLTATVKDSKNNPIEGLTIKWYINNNYLTGDTVTNSSGVATRNISFSSLGTYAVKVVFEGSNRYNTQTSNTVNLNVNQKLSSSVTNFVAKQNNVTILTAPTTDETICNSSAVTLTWNVKDSSNNNISNAVCEVWGRNGLITTLSAGVKTYTIPTSNIEDNIGYTYQIKVQEGDTYNDSSSDIISFVGIEYKEPTINATLSKNYINLGETVTITGTVTDQNNNPIRNVPVKLHSQEWNYNPMHTEKTDLGIIATANTNNNGTVTFNLNNTVGSGSTETICGRWWYTLEIDSAECRTSAESSSVVLTMEKVTPTITVSNLSCYEGYCKLSATLKANNVAISGEDMYVRVITGSGYHDYIDVHATTNSSGKAVFDLTSLSAGSYQAAVVFNGNYENEAYQQAIEEITIDIIEDHYLTITNLSVSTNGATLSNTNPVCCIGPNETITINSTVKTTAGNIVSGLRVAFLLGNNLFVEGLTNSQGKVTVSEVAPSSGDYVLSMQVPNQGSYMGCTKEFSTLIIEDSTTMACEDYIS